MYIIIVCSAFFTEVYRRNFDSDRSFQSYDKLIGLFGLFCFVRKSRPAKVAIEGARGLQSRTDVLSCVATSAGQYAANRKYGHHANEIRKQEQPCEGPQFSLCTSLDSSLFAQWAHSAVGLPNGNM